MTKIVLTNEQLKKLKESFKEQEEIVNEEHQGSYMSIQSLNNMKTQIDELIHMIPDGVELDDWIEDHIIKAGDDIDEVYQFLKHKNV